MCTMDFSNNIILIEALKKGNEEAYKYLMKSFNNRLIGYAIALVKNPDQAQDIVQNVYLKLWRFRNRLDDNFPLKSYLFKSVYNEFVDQYRRGQLILPLEQSSNQLLGEIAETYTYEEVELLMARVGKEIEKLPKKSKEVFVLSKKEGLTNIEISEYLNVSVKTVEAHITKSFSLLREKLGTNIDLYLFMMLRLQF